METDFCKFSRTRHIFDVGGNGVTRDDLVFSSKEAENFIKEGTAVIIEEKIDGANIGISIAEDYQIKVQNRSHYVDSFTHKQFSTLNSWIEQHSEDLFSVLTPGRHILFGEWLFAKHSIHYTNLPDYFIAFDIFDKKEKRFFSLTERNQSLKNTGIKYVHQICKETNITKKRLLELLDTKSVYYDGYIEGIVIRKVCSIEKLNGIFFQMRAKLVRPDFLQQIDEQWTRRKFEKNKLSNY